MRSEPKLVAELTVTAADGGVLEELAKQLAGDDVVFGPLREIDADSQLYLDPLTVAGVAKSVTAVIGAIAGGAKLVEYLVALLKKSPKERILVKVGSTIVTVTSDAPPDEVRSALRAALKVA